MIPDEQIKQLAVSHGFKLTNETGDDLKPYVYEFTRDIIALAQQIVEPTWRLVSGYMVTETGIGTYAIDHDAGYYMIIFNDDKYRALYDTEAEAIEAANADYQRRVLSCLVNGGV